MSSILFTFLGIVSEKYVELLNYNDQLRIIFDNFVNCYDKEYDIACILGNITKVAIILVKDKQIFEFPLVVLTDTFSGSNVEVNIANIVGKIKQLETYLTNFVQVIFQIQDVVTRLLITNELNQELLTQYDVDFLNLMNSISTLDRKNQFLPILNTLEQLQLDISNGIKTINVIINDRVNYTNQINNAILDFVNNNNVNTFLEDLLKITNDIGDIIQYVGENPTEILTKAELREIQYAQRTAQQNYASRIKSENVQVDDPQCLINAPILVQICLDKYEELKQERDKVQKKIIYNIQKEERDRKNKKNIRDKQIKDILENLPPIEPFNPEKDHVTGKMGFEIVCHDDIDSEAEKQKIIDDINNNQNLTNDERAILTSIIELGISDFYLLRDINDTSTFEEIVEIINNYIDQCQL